MKVSLVVNAYIGPNVRGGTGKEGYQLALDLKRRGVLAKVFCKGVSSGIDIPSENIIAACRSSLCAGILQYLSKAVKRYPGLRLRRHIEQWMDRYFARNVDSTVGDILYCPKPLYPRTFERAHRYGARVVVETSVLHPRHNLEMVSQERRRLALGGTSGYTDESRVRIIEKTLDLADVVYAWSPYLRASYLQYGLKEDKVRTGSDRCEPPGVDIVRFHPITDRARDDQFIVLHVSSITVIKGVQYLIEAWHSLGDRVSGRLLLVGPQDRDMRVIRGRYADASISWVGPVKEPVTYYQRASIFVSPSISDAGPRSVLESMACGVPAIVSDQCGIATSIESGVNGFVYCHDDVEKLAELIEWCYMNRKQVRSMGEKALETVKGYSVGDYPGEVWNRIVRVESELND